MSEKKHIEIDFKDKNDVNDDLNDSLEIGADLNSFNEHKNGCAYDNEENDRRMTLQEKEDAKIELTKQAIKNPPIRHEDDVNYNPDLNCKDDEVTKELLMETIDKTRHIDVLANSTSLQKKWDKSAQEHNNQKVPVTEKVKDIIDFDIVRNLNNIYADAYKEMDKEKSTNPNYNFNSNIRDYNIGSSDYSQHKIQPWDIWEDYNLNPWDADIVKRVLRKKELPGLEDSQSRIEDYQKIIHICLKRIDQIKNNSNII